MRSSHYPFLLPLFCFLLSVLISGCAAQKSVIVLLPEYGKASGEVTVVNAQGSQRLNQSWQSVEIAGYHSRPATPKVLNQATVQQAFGVVRSGTPSPPVHCLLYFKLDSSEVLPDSKLLLPGIAKVIKERHPVQLSVVGHTDTTGSADYNQKLGLLRARAVLELLVPYGVDLASVEIFTRGKTDLQVKTPDQTLEPRNRRAEVTIR